VNADGAIGGNPAIGSYLKDGIMPPNPNEAGWKDTVVMKPGEVTRIVVRFAPQDVAVNDREKIFCKVYIELYKKYIVL
jgi:spore coat protein A